jgi:hypothetical protein
MVYNPKLRAEIEPLCLNCLWLQVWANKTRKFPPNCAAFPEGIPEEIWNGEFNHRKPHKEDQGLQYRPLK